MEDIVEKSIKVSSLFRDVQLPLARLLGKLQAMDSEHYPTMSDEFIREDIADCRKRVEEIRENLKEVRLNIYETVS